MAMANDSAAAPPPPRVNWRFFEYTSLLRKCFRTAKLKENQLKKAVVENDYSEVCAFLKREKHHNHQLNKLWMFSTEGCTLYVPAMCVAVCNQNLPILYCLLQHGANPNRMGRIHTLSPRRGLETVATVSPLMMALEHHPSERLPFDPAVASALVDAGADINSTADYTIAEEEEEGGTISYKAHDTLLHKCVDVFLPYAHSSAILSFLLDKGANLFIRDSEDGFTVLQKCLHGLTRHPDDKRLGSYAVELIRHEGFTSMSLARHQSDFSFLVKAMVKAVQDNEDTVMICHIAHLLLDAGYVCSQTDVATFRTSEAQNVDPSLADKVYGLHIYCLKHLCRQKIRKSMRHLNCLDKLTGVPKILIDYLK
ncbi:uncharacterized protein LOC143300424 isoform X2 [Babylonia areolata]|uniref:uncharacterized protein LOC143300424 isoform X2 n=1 Tax=Babylonia areolata TaxID=304850 RepID=UPI003FD24090